MSRKGKKTRIVKADSHQGSLSFTEWLNNTNTPVPGKTPLIIGGDAGPATRYYRYDANGNILLDNSFDPADPWWGLSYGGFPPQPVIVGRTQEMLKVSRLVRKLADFNVSVLLQGQSGTGKELVARALSSARGGPFEPLNCGLPVDGVTFEDTLFGRVDKVIAGAPGLQGAFQLADGGILFLDNIDCLSWDQQGKLLRVLDCQPQVVRRIGSRKDEIVNVRIICATNQDLLSLVNHRRFREDLYYRINTVQVNLPPLCARKEDIPILTVYLLFRNRPRFARNVSMISRETLEKLSSYHWPANVRQLNNAIQGALAVGEGPVVEPEDFTFDSPYLPGSGIYGPFPQLTSGKHKRESCQDRAEKIRELLQQKPGATARELASIAGCSARTIERKLTGLKDEIVVSRKDETDARVKRYYLVGDASKVG